MPILFRSTEDFVTFVDSISVQGGGDTAEDVIGGLRVVLNPAQIKWNSDIYATKVRITCDAGLVRVEQFYNTVIIEYY